MSLRIFSPVDLAQFSRPELRRRRKNEGVIPNEVELSSCIDVSCRKAITKSVLTHPSQVHRVQTVSIMPKPSRTTSAMNQSKPQRNVAQSLKTAIAERLSQSYCSRSLESAADLCVKFGVQEVVVWVRNAEGSTQESLRGRSLTRITEEASAIIVFFSQGRGGTYIVKQSYMKLKAAGPTIEETSSGIGGA